MDISSRWVKRVRHLSLVSRIVAAAGDTGQKVYLTGGHLRDRLLGRPAKAELDLTTADPPALVDALRLSGDESVFLMDRERATYRFVLSPAAAVSYIDLTRLRSDTVEGDLRLRDFTVNALAVELSRAEKKPLVIDPTGGLGDGERKILRVCSKASIRDDPLRALRGIRLSSTLGLTLEETTRSLILRSRAGLGRVAAERVRDEVFQILQGPAPLEGLAAVLDLELLRHLGPPFRSHPGSSVRRLRPLLSLIGRFHPGGSLRQALGHTLEYGVTRYGLLLLAGLLSRLDLAWRGDDICRRLVLGKRASRLLATTLGTAFPEAWFHGRTRPGRGEMRTLFHSCDECVEEVTLLHGARVSPVKSRKGAVQMFLDGYRRRRRIFQRPPLLSGEIALQSLPVGPGPALGKLLAGAKEAQDLGRVRTRAGTLAWARRYSRDENG